PTAWRNSDLALWPRQLGAFGAGTTHAGLAAWRWGCIEIGARVEPADQSETAAVLLRKARQVVGPIAASARKEKAPLRMPMEQHCQELAPQDGRGLVPAAQLDVPGLGMIERDHHRPRPGTGREGELHQDSHNAPLVAPAVRREGVGGAHGGAMAGFAKHLATRMLFDGIVAHDYYRPGGHPMREDESSQRPTEPPGRPTTLGEAAMVTGGMAHTQIAHRPQDIGHGTPPGGQHSGLQ